MIDFINCVIWLVGLLVIIIVIVFTSRDLIINITYNLRQRKNQKQRELEYEIISGLGVRLSYLDRYNSYKNPEHKKVVLAIGSLLQSPNTYMFDTVSVLEHEINKWENKIEVEFIN